MPADFSLDLRQRIAAAAHLGTEEAARTFSVSPSTVKRIRARLRKGLPLTRLQQRFGPERDLKDEHKAFFVTLLAENPSRSQADMAARFGEQHAFTPSRASVGRALSRWGLTRKKSASGRRSSTEKT